MEDGQVTGQDDLIDGEAGLTTRIVARIQGGDRESFERLFSRYLPRLEILARAQIPQWLRPLVDPDDVIQETCLRAFRGIGSFRRWLGTILESCVTDMIRLHRAGKRFQPDARKVSLDQAAGDSSLGPRRDVAATGSTPSGKAIEGERFRAILEAIECLPEEQRQVFALRYLQGLSVAETCARLDLKESSVKMAALRATRRLSEVLGRRIKDGQGPPASSPGPSGPDRD
jgi:RNA polymerase sigma-70 factor (ECF subfamily)